MSTPSDDIQNFKVALKKLMAKHNISSISWGCSECSDTHGLSDEHMLIVHKDWRHQERVSDSHSLEQSDL